MTDEPVVCPDCKKVIDSTACGGRPRSVALRWMWLANVIDMHRRMDHPELVGDPV